MGVVRGWQLAAGLLVAAALVSPSAVRAFPNEPYSLDEGEDAHSKRFQLLGELGMFFGNIEGGADVKLLSPLFELRLQLADNWLLDAAWGFSYVNLTLDGVDQRDNAFRPGNPWVAPYYQGVKGQFSYRFGIGVTVPVARLPDDLGATPDNLTASAAYALAAAVRGNTEYWLWEPHSLSIIVPMSFERRKPSGFLWGANFATGVMLKCCGSQAERNSNQRNDPVVQLGAMMGYQALDWLRVGSTFTLVIMPRKKAQNQDTQLAVMPYLRFGSEDAFGSIGLTINLDNPWGFSFDANQVWGLLIGGGAAF